MPFVDSWAVQGQTTSARLARMMLQAATGADEGVLTSTDLACLALDVPAGEVTLNPGSVVIVGKEQPGQGSYQGAIYSLESVSINPTGSASGRSDLIVIQAEDPTVDGTPWNHDPASEPVMYARVLEGVTPGTTTVPEGISAIPIARIDIPASTGTITQEYIHDLRRVVLAREKVELRVQRGGTQSNGEWDEAGNIVSPDSERWPQHDWPVVIPEWATQVQIIAHWSNVYLEPRTPTGSNDARGSLFVGFSGGPTFLSTTPSAYNFNQTSATNGYRCSSSNFDQISIPREMRGRSVQVRMYVEGTPGQAGRLVADNWANFSVEMRFLEYPAPEAAL
ncbi:hypothetical protein ACFYOC_24140 [Nocardiopsis alba]|uniref:hypothetical protein n=1 Tax=Nocardiopsis alba TaxID=53437 RepID=UPI00368B3BDA